tara:strand:- start:281 stop:1327 length:1047 start_codon:yes stop_codon:yes gene_type:complete
MSIQKNNILNPLVSVIIPCRNEINYISDLINSIFINDIGMENIEILIIDGMSDDGTRDLIIKKFVSKYKNIFLIDNLKQKTPYAFNIGIRKAKGKIVSIIGARHIISPNYLSEVFKVLTNDKNIGCVGGVTQQIFENKKSKIISKAMSTSFGIGFSNFRLIRKDTYVDTVGSPSFRKNIFDEIGFFDEQLTRNQDDDFSFRLVKQKYKILLKADIWMKYKVRASFRMLFKQYKQYGYWKVFVNKKHKTVTTLRQLFPMVFVLSLFLLILLSLIFPAITYLLIFELAFYTALNMFFSLKDNGLNLINGFKQMYTYLILHISYGLGYLEGIYDFLLLNKLPNEKNEKLSR